KQFVSLERLLSLDDKDSSKTMTILASASSEMLLAAFLNGETDGGKEVAKDFGCDLKQSLFVATVGCAGADVCEPRCVPVGPLDQNQGLAVFGHTVRFFASDPEPSTPKSPAVPKGENASGSGGSPVYRLLQVYDGTANKLTPVARVDTSDKRYSALRE